MSKKESKQPSVASSATDQSVAPSNFVTHATGTGTSRPHTQPPPRATTTAAHKAAPASAPAPGGGQDNPVFVFDEPLAPPPKTPESEKQDLEDQPKAGSQTEIKRQTLGGRAILPGAFKLSSASDTDLVEKTRESTFSSVFTRASILPRITRFQSYAKPSIIPEHKTPQGKCSGCWHKYLGIILTLLTSLVMSLGSFFVKLLQENGQYSPFYTVFWRFLGVFVPAVPTLIYFKYFTKKDVFGPLCPPNKNGNWKAVIFIVIRGLVGTSGFIFQYFALNFITLADTSVISFSSPVFVILLGRLCLKEECGFFNTGIAICTVVGVFIIAKPPFIFGGEEMSTDTLTGIGLAVGCCFSNTLVYLCLRFLKDVHFSVISIVFGTIGLIISSSATIFDKGFEQPKNLEHWFLFFGVAGLGFLGQVGLTFALKYEQAGIVSAFRTSDVIYSFMWQLAIGILPTMFSVIGATVVITCVSLLAFRKWLMDKDPDTKIRQRLWWVLK